MRVLATWLNSFNDEDLYLTRCYDELCVMAVAIVCLQYSYVFVFDKNVK